MHRLAFQAPPLRQPKRLRPRGLVWDLFALWITALGRAGLNVEPVSKQATQLMRALTKPAAGQAGVFWPGTGNFPLTAASLLIDRTLLDPTLRRYPLCGRLR